MSKITHIDIEKLSASIFFVLSSFFGTKVSRLVKLVTRFEFVLIKVSV